MVSTDLALVTGSGPRRARPTARRAIGRPGLKTLLAGMVASWREALRPGSRPGPRHALIEAATS